MRPVKLFLSTVIVSVASLPFAVHAADVEALPDATVSEGQEILQCQSDLLAFEDELARAGFGVLAPGGYVDGYAGYKTGYGLIGTPRQQMQVLRDAAGVYALADDEKACQMVLASMRKIYDAHDELVGFESENPEARTAWRRAHLAKAVPLTEMGRLMRADVVIDADIRTADDTMLGEIKDVIFDPKRQTIAYVLASRGGFLGLGQELIAVRWTDLRATEDHEIYVLDVSPEAFIAAPKVERQNFAESFDEGWRNRLDQYWAGVIATP